LALAGWDSLVATVAYMVLFRLRIGAWWGQTWQAVGLTLGWVTLSYLLGRYSKTSLQAPLRKPWRSQTLQAAMFLLAAVQLHSWLFRVLMEATRFRGFLLPFVGLIALGSLAGQTWLRKKIRTYDKPWLIVANRKEQEILDREFQVEKDNGIPEEGHSFLHTIDDLKTEIKFRNITGIAISHSVLQERETLETLLKERQRGLECCSLEDWCENKLQRLPPELLDRRSLIVADGYQLQPGTLNWRIKRLGDLGLASFLLVVSSPLMIMAMVVIKLEDGGPCLYKQRRTGLFGQEIWIRKLRTMRVDAEKNGAQWAQANDPRITRSGHWLRTFRIDELPQLWAVVCGEMSLIGPRPERPELEKSLRKSLPNYQLRSWLRPGLSGWAQVCYPYGASLADSRNKLSYDLYYLRNANLLLDILIMFKTVRLVLGGQGASPLTHSPKDRQHHGH
jgi:exopolysaccharide biosynthesis polyprenyl glycosylphosphotransferase